MNSNKHLFGKPYFASLVCKGSETFMKKMLPFCLIMIGCFYHVMNDHPPLGLQWNLLTREALFQYLGSDEELFSFALKNDFKPMNQSLVSIWELWVGKVWLTVRLSRVKRWGGGGGGALLHPPLFGFCLVPFLLFFPKIAIRSIYLPFSRYPCICEKNSKPFAVRKKLGGRGGVATTLPSWKGRDGRKNK